MMAPFDPGSDLARVADGIEPATVTRPGSSLVTVVPHALRSAIRLRRVAESADRYTANDVVWHLPVDELNDAPQVGDVIVDSTAGRWTVLDVQKKTLGTRWRCMARNLAVVHGLDAYVDIEKSEIAKGPSGTETRRWRVWKTGLHAKIQPTQTKVRRERDRQVTESQFKIYLVQDLDLDRTHRVRGPDGAIYHVTGMRRAERVDTLMEIDVVQVG